MSLALQGAALFAFIPLVLFLYLQLPLGPGSSLLLGLALMLAHRFVASPWMARHSRERCLWCGRTGNLASPLPIPLPIRAEGRDWTLAACGAAHADLAGRFLTFVERRRAWIALGIFLPLALLLVGTAALALGHPFIAHDGNRLQFRTIVALTVVGVSLAYRTVPAPAAPLRSPFPLHNLFLLGIRATLWVFRIVGVAWLGLGLIALVRAWSH
jgi:hypothetical protein